MAHTPYDSAPADQTARADAQVVLTTDGVTVLLDVSAGRLPAILHWGADLGEVTAADFEAISVGSIAPVVANAVDEPIRLSLLPESWAGWTGRPGVSGSREGRAWSPKFTSAAVRIDGEPVAGLTTAGPATVEVDAADADAGLAVTVRVELTIGGVLRSQVTLTNTADDLYQLDDLVLAYPVPEIADEILDLAGRWGKERVPQRQSMVVGTHLREGRKGRTGADAATVLHLGRTGFGFAEGEVWAVHTGWSGNHTHYAERLYTGAQVIGGGELLLPGEIRLEPGATYTTPWLYGSYGVGLDQVARRFHRFLRARDHHPSTRRPVTLNVWEAVYFDHDLNRLLDLAERASRLGVERYVLDDGWFGSRRDDTSGLGDWTVSPDMWPTGLAPLINKVTELGMEFGLWFEPEMINIDSDVARAHPEWIMQVPGRLPVESRHQQVINLGIAECYAYIRDAIFAILAEYDVAYIKWDHNRDLVDAGTTPVGQPGVHDQTLAFYRLLDEIKAAHPGLEIESCSSGGARVDLGVLERTERVWVSDCIDPLERQQMNRWTTQLIPPELMGSHIASGRNHTTGRVHDLNFRAASAMFGHLGIEWDLARASDAELAELGSWLAFHKEHRDLLLSGDLVRIDLADPSQVGHGVVAPDQSAAVYSYAVVSRSGLSSVGRLRFPGLDPAARYRLVPVLPGGRPHGLRAPDWWGLTGSPVPYSTDNAALDSTTTGVIATGATLAHVGLIAPELQPEQAALYTATRI